jgi:hypothetical protein
MKKNVGEIRERFSTLPKLAFKHWRKITPKRTGNARRKTRLRKNEIQARYPYAERLDNGWSKQAPDGMFEPTVEFIKKRSKRMLRKR